MKKFSKLICLEGNTKVKTPNGDILIKDIKPGMSFLSYDFEKNTFIENVTIATAKSLHSRCAIIEFETGISLMITVDHPLFVQGKGWCTVETNESGIAYGVAVKQLSVGDDCLRFKNNDVVSVKVKSITIKSCSDYFYCLETNQYRNFFANDIIVHDVKISMLTQNQLLQEGIEVLR